MFSVGKQRINGKEVNAMSFENVANLSSEEIEKINSLQEEIKKTCGKNVVLVAYNGAERRCCQ